MSVMPRFVPSTDHPPQDDFSRDLERGLDSIFSKLADILNGGLLLADNFDGFLTTITTDATPGVESAIAHGLKRVPSGYLVLKRDQAGILYDGSTAWDSTNIYVRSNVASLTVTLFIL